LAGEHHQSGVKMNFQRLGFSFGLINIYALLFLLKVSLYILYNTKHLIQTLNFVFAFLQSNLLVSDERYPHIVYVAQETMDDIRNKASLVAGDQTIDLEGLLNLSLYFIFIDVA
jgi:hypothetical protein